MTSQCPTQNYPLHDYQKRAIQFGLRHKSVYYAIDTGLGKTRIVLELVKKLKRSLLVYGPLNTILHTWPSEIEKWAPELSYTVLHGACKDFNITELNKDIYLLNYEGIKWFYTHLRKPLSYWTPTMVCYDEASFIKSPSTQRFKMLKRLMALSNKYRFALSATPAPEGYHNLWAQYHLLNPDLLNTSYYGYRNTYFNYLGPPIYKTTIQPHSAAKIENKIGSITFRLKAEDHLKMPKLIFNKIKLVLPKKIQVDYTCLEKEFYLELTDHNIVVNNTASLTNKLRQFIQGGIYDEGGYPNYAIIHDIKAKMLKELIGTHEGHNLLCLVQYRFEIDILKKVLGPKIAVIAGETKAALTKQHITNWNKSKIPVMVCHPSSISHGLNLQSGGHIVVWVGVPYSMQIYYQTIRRLYRQGQTNKSVIVHHLLMQNTLDTEIYRAVKAKEKQQETLLSNLKKYLGDKYT